MIKLKQIKKIFKDLNILYLQIVAGKMIALWNKINEYSDILRKVLQGKDNNKHINFLEGFKIKIKQVRIYQRKY